MEVPLILLISTIVNGTLLNFGKRYDDKLRVIIDQCPKLHLGLDALSNQKILNCIYELRTYRAITGKREYVRFIREKVTGVNRSHQF